MTLHVGKVTLCHIRASPRQTENFRSAPSWPQTTTLAIARTGQGIIDYLSKNMGCSDRRRAGCTLGYASRISQGDSYACRHLVSISEPISAHNALCSSSVIA